MSHAETHHAPSVQEAASLKVIRPFNRQVRRLLLLIVVPVLTLLAIGVMYLMGGRYVETDNAYVKADMIPVAAEVSGAVVDVLVSENQYVNAGDLLFRLDPEPFQVRVTKAEANLAQVRTDLKALKASYREKQAEITLAQTKYAFALKELHREADLLKRHFVSTSRFDDVKQRADLAKQQIIVLEKDLKRIADSLGGSVDLPIEQHPRFRVASAALAQVQLDLQRTAVKASKTGIVTKLPKPGQYVTAGSTALALIAIDNLWVEANFTETDLTYINPGQSVEVRVDTYPNKVWIGTVESLSPATGAEFSVIPAQNATGNWVKISQRVPVRIKINDPLDQRQLRAGLSAIVEVDTGHRRTLLGLSL
ncbi:HlyD family secretion protein [Zooshikella sp. RANM57]|uniref:HlyD family secretion protein n=1 Tax=Zooshikella sp. RANM57 TaxID=3425863 RepID=UPI003D6EA8A9